MFTVYKISNIKNDKVYVGYTQQPLAHRWACHRSYATHGYGKSQLYEEMRYIGVDKFSIEKIDTVDSIIKARELEEKYMIELDTLKNGYNHNRPTHNKPITETEDDNRSKTFLLKASIVTLNIISLVVLYLI